LGAVPCLDLDRIRVGLELTLPKAKANKMNAAHDDNKDCTANKPINGHPVYRDKGASDHAQKKKGQHNWYKTGSRFILAVKKIHNVIFLIVDVGRLHLLHIPHPKPKVLDAFVGEESGEGGEKRLLLEAQLLDQGRMGHDDL
jgi:hypothetical protein